MAEDEQGNLEPPPRTSIDDPGAHDLESSDSDDHFSDAQSGVDPVSPIPSTKGEKVNDKPGKVFGTDAYHIREQDAISDTSVIPTGQESRSASVKTLSTPGGGQPIPTTIVEKIDPSSPSHGEVPGTLAHEKRAADAVPDLVVKAGDLSPPPNTRSRAGSTPGDLPIPITKVEKVDSKPSHGEVPGTNAYEIRKADAEPDIVEEIGSPTFSTPRSAVMTHARRKSSAAGKKGPASPAVEYNETEDGSDGGFGDDFDDFEEGEEDAEFDDFGDDDFQKAAPAPPPRSSLLTAPLFPVLDFANLNSPEDIREATEPYLNAIFPPETIESSVLPTVSAENPVFLTPRSASLWSQLITPPPLQPPNWIRSRIRRLFLVSLGVPVDLDEILPASKQKKLILPSMNLNLPSGSPRTSTDDRISRLKQGEGNTSTTSLDSQGKPARSESRRRRGPPPAPQLDLVSARQLCAITDEALNGLTMEELKDHVRRLESMQGTANEVLEYWTTRTDEKLGDREAFEGVIENLVKHARKVRK